MTGDPSPWVHWSAGCGEQPFQLARAGGVDHVLLISPAVRAPGVGAGVAVDEPDLPVLAPAVPQRREEVLLSTLHSISLTR